jgi:hypothetical protein
LVLISLNMVVVARAAQGSIYHASLPFAAWTTTRRASIWLATTSWKFRLLENGGKFNELVAHHDAEAYLDAYRRSGLTGDDTEPRKRTVNG